MPKPKERNMRLLISCKRKGAPLEAMQVDWCEPEDKAKETFAKFQKALTVLCKEHGMMKD